MNDHDLFRLVCETTHAYLALGNEGWEAHHATFVRNRATPRRYDSNNVGLVRAESESEIEALLGEIDRGIQGFEQRMIVMDALMSRAFETRLANGGRLPHGAVRRPCARTRARDSERPAVSAQSDIDVREVVTEADRAAYRDLDELWWRESGESEALFGP